MTLENIKILHCPNLLNAPYTIVSFLRKKGVDAHVLLNYDSFPYYHPQWEEGDFEIIGLFTEKETQNINDIIKIVGDKWCKTPDFVKYIENSSLKLRLKNPKLFIEDVKLHGIKYFYYFLQNPSLKKPFYFLDWITAMKNCDILTTWNTHTAYAPFSKKPYLAICNGGDIMEVPYQYRKLSNMIIKGFKQAKYVLLHEPRYFISAKKLNLNNVKFYPLPIDVDKYKPVNSVEIQQIRDKCSVSLLIYHPTRHSWHVKGNDLFLKAFAKFVKEYKDSRLLTSLWGTDWKKSKKLIEKLGIGKYVSYVPQVAKLKLIKYYNACDIIIDQFILGGHGATVLEVMSCEKPVMIYLLEELYIKYYGEPMPVVNAMTEKEIYDKLWEMTAKDVRKDLGKKARNFILKHHYWEKPITQLIGYYEEMLEDVVK